MDTEGATAAAFASPICWSVSPAGAVMTTGSRAGGGLVWTQAAARSPAAIMRGIRKVEVIDGPSAKLILPCAQYREHFVGLSQAPAGVTLRSSADAWHIAAQERVHLDLQGQARGERCRSRRSNPLHACAIFECVPVGRFDG